MASLISSVVNFNWRPLKYNTAPIKDFYRLRFEYRDQYQCFNQIMCLIFISTLNLTFFRIKSKVLGQGVNGTVKQCVNKAGQKFALKV